MKKIVLSITIVLIFGFSQGQTPCKIQVSVNGGLLCDVDSISVCFGSNVTLHFAGIQTQSILQQNFNSGLSGMNNWLSSANPLFSNPCGAGPDLIYYWTDTSTAFPRYLISPEITGADSVFFYMKYAMQGQSWPCEGPDEPTEGINLQYSTAGINGPWITLEYWNPNGGYDPDLTIWKQYRVGLPNVPSLWLRWYQAFTSGNAYDHWGLDDIRVVSENIDPNITMFLYENNQVVANNVLTYSFVADQNVTYVLSVNNQGTVYTDTLYVEVYHPTLSIQNLQSQYYLNSPPDTLIGYPHPGYFLGPGITGNVFDPAAAGPGTHVITYFHEYPIYFISYFDSAYVLVFDDDFSTDKGWTGYGTQWSRGPAIASTGCSGSQDPSQDHTPTADNYLIGNWIGGCYQNNMNQTYWLTSPVVNCSGFQQCYIEFYSHTGVESSTYDKIFISAYNGNTWQQIWGNLASINEVNWTFKTFNIPQADNNPNFKVRFGIGPTDGSAVYKGWNIDDFKLICKTLQPFYDTVHTQTCYLAISQQVTVLNEMSYAEIPFDQLLEIVIYSSEGKLLLQKSIQHQQDVLNILKEFKHGLYLYYIRNIQNGKILQKNKWISH